MLWACSDFASLSPLSQDARILAFGDSLTLGVGASEGNSYPEVQSEIEALRANKEVRLELRYQLTSTDTILGSIRNGVTTASNVLAELEADMR